LVVKLVMGLVEGNDSCSEDLC